MSLKNHIFSVHLQENADFIKFLFAPRLLNVCNLIKIRLSYIHAMFHGLAQVDQILGRVDDSSPTGLWLIKRSGPDWVKKES